LYKVRHIAPGSVFAIEKYYDENYMIVPIDFAKDLLGYGRKRSQIELFAKPEKIQEVKEDLGRQLGNNYRVRLGEELHEDIYKIFRIEKLMVFLIFSIIIAIASINIYFSLSMLVIDKRKDVAILAAQGASKGLIRLIFLMEGCIIAFSGTLTGLLLGLSICFAQMKFGFITMGMQTAVMNAYPVEVELLDVLYTCLAVVLITIAASIQPARLAAKRIDIRQL
jgi:lipoprotein-releasing system permease protein